MLRRKIPISVSLIILRSNGYFAPTAIFEMGISANSAFQDQTPSQPALLPNAIVYYLYHPASTQYINSMPKICVCGLGLECSNLAAQFSTDDRRSGYFRLPVKVIEDGKKPNRHASNAAQPVTCLLRHSCSGVLLRLPQASRFRLCYV